MNGTDPGVFSRTHEPNIGRWPVLKSFEGLAYAALVLGAAADQMSTRYALSFGGIYETNPVAVQMMKLGLWQVFDAVILLAVIFMCGLIMRRCQFTNKWVLLLFPMVIGVFRLGAAFWNLSLVG